MKNKNSASENTEKKRLRRSESFLGIHFDFHAGDHCKEIGANTTEKMIEAIVEEVKPDYIQCDCKGHPGFSSYPTKVGNPAPGIKKDALKIWRSVTAKHGVALYMHYSGVWDAEAIKRHPSWARVNANGKRDAFGTSTFGPYVDKLLLPQLKELSDVYKVDGAWVDGECWGVGPEYGKKVKELFTKETGIINIPKKFGEPYSIEYWNFFREAFLRYVRHYVDEIHRHNPDFQIASNWSFTGYMPEQVSADVDFISGDYSPQNSVNAARFEGRCMASQGKPWDLMAWSFSGTFGRDDSVSSTKSVPQLEQEAAAVLALGGGFQAYFMQKADGSVCLWQMKLMKEVANFCRARQRICHKAKAVPQVALLYSGTEFYQVNGNLFGYGEGTIDRMRGTLFALLDSQFSTEITMEHHIEDRMSEYPVIINPEWNTFKPEFKEKLLQYVKNGGNLLVIGATATKGFENELGVEFEDCIKENANIYIEYNGWLAGIHTSFQKVKPKAGTKALAKFYLENDTIGPSVPAATVAKYGKGKIAGIYFNCGAKNKSAVTATFRDFIGGVVGELFKEPLVTVKGSHFVDVSVNTIDGKLAVNLLNTAGPHANANIFVFDEIPAIGPLEIAIRSKKKPKSVTLMPEDKPMDYTFHDGVIKMTLDELKIHAVIAVEE